MCIRQSTKTYYVSTHPGSFTNTLNNKTISFPLLFLDTPASLPLQIGPSYPTHFNRARRGVALRESFGTVSFFLYKICTLTVTLCLAFCPLFSS